MPFGAIFGVVFFGLVCPWLGLQFYGLPLDWAPAEAIGVSLALFGLAVALGLVLRRGWARWTGALLALPVGVFGLLLTRHAVAGFPLLQRGLLVVTLVVLLGALPTTALLLLPATGNLRRGNGAAGPPRGWVGGLTAAVAALTLAGLLLSGAWGLATPSPGGARAAAWSGATVSWGDFGPALERARQEHKLILVDFFATWCGPCHQMDKLTFRHPEVVDKLNGDVVAVRVDAEETRERHGFSGEALAEKYGVYSYPTLALIDAEGRLVAKRTGFQQADQLLRWLQETLSAGGGRPGALL